MRRLWWVMVVVGAACTKGPQPVDAGPAGEVDAGPRVRRSVDLRTAVVIAFPEYRGVPKVQGTSILTRTLSGRTDWQPVRDEMVKRVDLVPDLDGGWSGVTRGFHLSMTPHGDTATLSASLPFDGETVVRLFQAPAPISSADLAQLLPRGPGARVDGDVYELHMAYITETEHRAAFLVHQATLLLLKNGQWKVKTLPAGWAESLDAGEDDLPERFDVELEGLADGARFWAHRQGRYVDVLYSLVTDAPG